MTLKPTLHAALIRFRREERGASLVEFAVSIVLFMTLIVGIAWFAMAMYAYHYVSYSAQQAARYAIVRGADWGTTTCAAANSYACNATAANVQSYIRSVAPAGINPNDVTVTTTWPGTTPSGSATGCSPANKSGCLVNVTISYPFAMYIPLVPTTSLQFSASAQMVVQE